MAEELSSITMESHASSAKKRSVKKNDKLNLEDYIHFLQSRQALHLTMNQLNQVIQVHGFKKIHHAPKKVLIDAVETLDLVNLPRSTLHENVSAFAVVPLEEVITDLEELNWQECCVTSVEKICSSFNGESLFPASSSDQNLRLMNHSQSQNHARKTKRMDEISSLVPEAFQRSLQATKMVPKRKRSNHQALDSATSTVDSASLASC